MFVTATGDYLTNATPGMLAATPIGWGGCLESLATGNCVSPLDARIAVADNNYLYPTVPDRSWRPSPLDPPPTFQYGATDSLDQLAGHELGHALGLAHVTGSTNLMFGTSTDNDGDGDVDNIAMTAAETTQARNAALGTSGLEVDPPNEFVPGRFVRTRLPDAEGKRDARLEDGEPAHLELAAVAGILDTETETVMIDVQLGTVVQQEVDGPFEAWIMFDLPEVETGATAAAGSSAFRSPRGTRVPISSSVRKSGVPWSEGRLGDSSGAIRWRSTACASICCASSCIHTMPRAWRGRTSRRGSST
jgi:hypothetical protein